MSNTVSGGVVMSNTVSGGRAVKNKISEVLVIPDGIQIIFTKVPLVPVEYL